MKQKKEEINFSDIISIFIPKIWILAVVAIVFAGIFGVYSLFFKNDTYTSSSTMYVYRSSQTPSSTDLQLAEKMIETYSIFLISDDALKEVISKIPEEYELKDSITVDAVRNAVSFISRGNGIFIISVTSEDPRLSFYLAKAFEDVSIGTIKLKVPNALPIQVLESPSQVSTPNGKGTLKSAVLGFAIGAVLSTVVVFVISFFDSIVRSKKKIEDNLSIPVLGVIPILTKSAKNEKGV